MKESAASEIKIASASARRKAGASSPVFDEQGARSGPLMNMVQRAGCSGCPPALASLAGRMAGMPAGSRKEAALSLQRARGNRFVQRLAVQAKLTVGSDEKELRQGRLGAGGVEAELMQTKPESNRTGMPDRLKAGIELFSGIDMSDVRVHDNSDKPAQLNALAYTQGNQIHLGPGQGRHLPHEAWHVVQQKQGRVQATTQMKGLGINDDPSLEHEADMMGTKTAQFVPAPDEEMLQEKHLAHEAWHAVQQDDGSVAQLMNYDDLKSDIQKTNVHNVQSTGKGKLAGNARDFMQTGKAPTYHHIAPKEKLRTFVKQRKWALDNAENWMEMIQDEEHDAPKQANGDVLALAKAVNEFKTTTSYPTVRMVGNFYGRGGNGFSGPQPEFRNDDPSAGRERKKPTTFPGNTWAAAQAAADLADIQLEDEKPKNPTTDIIRSVIQQLNQMISALNAMGNDTNGFPTSEVENVDWKQLDPFAELTALKNWELM